MKTIKNILMLLGVVFVAGTLIFAVGNTNNTAVEDNVVVNDSVQKKKCS